MLATEKENLLADTNQRIARLREKELSYYVNHLGGVQTIATLIAGFSFTALVRMDSTLNMAAFLFITPSGEVEALSNSTTGYSLSTPIMRSLDPIQVFAFMMQVGELFAVVCCLGEMMHVLTLSLIGRLLGTRLALRGPDGSIIRATRHLANSLSNCTRVFFNGLQYFLLSVFFHVLRTQHPTVGAFLICVLFPYWRGQGELAKKLTIDFYLVVGVNTAFDDRPSALAGEMDLNPKSERANTRTDEAVYVEANAALSRSISRKPKPLALGHADAKPDGRVEELEEGRSPTKLFERSASRARRGELPSIASSGTELRAKTDGRRRTALFGDVTPPTEQQRQDALKEEREEEREEEEDMDAGDQSTRGTQDLPSEILAQSMRKRRPTPEPSRSRPRLAETAASWWRSLRDYLNPVNHRLAFLSTVVDDFEGEGKIGDARHRNPSSATHHLIQRTELRQAETLNDPQNGFFSPRLGSLMNYSYNDLVHHEKPDYSGAWSTMANWARTPVSLETPQSNLVPQSRSSRDEQDAVRMPRQPQFSSPGSPSPSRSRQTPMSRGRTTPSMAGEQGVLDRVSGDLIV